MREHHRPAARTGEFFEAFEAGADPAMLREAADRAAALLVRGAQASSDPGVGERLTHLAETEGMETLAELWSGAPGDSLAGSLWRLYLLRTWVYADPQAAAAQFQAGRDRAQVARVVSGVAEPPGPEELKAMVDAVLRGVATSDYADVLHRAAAFAYVIATGRGLGLEPGPDEAPDPSGAKRMFALAEQLEQSARAELRGELG